MWIKPSNATTQGIHMKYNKAKIVKGYEHKLSNPKQFTRNLLSGKRWTSSWTCDSFQLTDKHQYTLKTTISHPPVLEDRRRWIEWKSHFHVKTELYITTPPTRAASHPSQHLVKKKKTTRNQMKTKAKQTNKTIVVTVDSLLTDTSVKRTLMVCSCLSHYSLYLTLYEMDASLRRTLSARPKCWES